MKYFDKVVEIIKKEMDMELDPDLVITPDMDLAADLRIDSLSRVLIIGDLENEYDVSIDAEEMVEIRSVEDICEKLEELLG